MGNLSALFRRGCVVGLFLVLGQLCWKTVLAQSVGGDRRAALFQAIRSGSVDSLERVLAGGADANDSLGGCSALMAATLNGSVEQMKLLLDHGANPNGQGRMGISALWLAVPDYDKTKLLLDRGADVQHKIGGYGILAKLAAIPGTIRLFGLLMERGADLKKTCSDNFLLYNAAISGDSAIVGLLLRCGLRVNDTTSSGDIPIDAALEFRSFATLKMLVDSGANVNFQSMTIQVLPAFLGFTPLMYAAWANDNSSVLYLLEHGANPNLRNKQGYTALMLLEQAETDNPELTRVMIDHGAVVSAKAPDGTDALYYAQRKGDTGSVEILRKYTGHEK